MGQFDPRGVNPQLVRNVREALDDAGFDVRCCDLSIERLSADALAGAGMVAVYLPMHTATRIAFEVLPKVRALAPRAVLCAYGLYAPVNARGLRRLGVDTVIGGEYEPHLLELAERVRAGEPSPALVVVSDTAKIAFRTPLRDALPALDRYAAIVMPDGASSSSVIVVVTLLVVARLGDGPPPPEGLEMVTVKVSPAPSSIVSAVVCTVKVCEPAAVLVKVSVPDFAV